MSLTGSIVLTSCSVVTGNRIRSNDTNKPRRRKHKMKWIDDVEDGATDVW